MAGSNFEHSHNWGCRKVKLIFLHPRKEGQLDSWVWNFNGRMPVLTRTSGKYPEKLFTYSEKILLLFMKRQSWVFYMPDEIFARDLQYFRL